MIVLVKNTNVKYLIEFGQMTFDIITPPPILIHYLPINLHGEQ